jgi:hypothetical protein
VRGIPSPPNYVANYGISVPRYRRLARLRHIIELATLRIRHPPWVFDGKADIRPRMKDSHFGEPVISQLRYPGPRESVPLTAPPMRAAPQVGYVVSECLQCSHIGRHRMVIEEAGDNLFQPEPLFRDGPVHPPTQLLFDFLQLAAHAVTARVPLKLKLAAPRNAADEGKPEEGDGLRFAKPASLAVARRIAPELNQTGLLRMKRQRELLEPRPHRLVKAPGVSLVLEAGYNIVGITHDDHIARGLAPSPALGPEVEDIVQIHVGE